MAILQVLQEEWRGGGVRREELAKFLELFGVLA
jgi:hypothetical protein